MRCEPRLTPLLNNGFLLLNFIHMAFQFENPLARRKKKDLSFEDFRQTRLDQQREERAQRLDRLSEWVKSLDVPQADQERVLEQAKEQAEAREELEQAHEIAKLQDTALASLDIFFNDKDPKMVLKKKQEILATIKSEAHKLNREGKAFDSDEAGAIMRDIFLGNPKEGEEDKKEPERGPGVIDKIQNRLKSGSLDVIKEPLVNLTVWELLPYFKSEVENPDELAKLLKKIQTISLAESMMEIE